MKTYLLIGIILLSLFVIGCTSEESFLDKDYEQRTKYKPNLKCDPPFIEFTPGDCCRDVNNNSLCDVKEHTIPPPKKHLTMAEQIAARNISPKSTPIKMDTRPKLADVDDEIRREAQIYAEYCYETGISLDDCSSQIAEKTKRLY